MDEIKENNSILLEQTKKESSNKSFLFLFLLLIVIFILGAYLFNNEYVNSEKLVEQKIKEVEGIIDNIDNTINNNQLMLVKMQKKLEAYEDDKDVLADLVSQPIKDQFKINKDYALSEVEHLLTIANHNILLRYDYETALVALDTARIRLSGINIKEANIIQQQINKDIDILRTSNQKDLSNTVLFLSELSARIDSFPLKRIYMQSEKKNNKKINGKEVEGIKSFFTLILDELHSLIIVTRNQNSTHNFFLPKEFNLLKLNIKFELANAKFAILNRDKENLHASILQVNNYLKEYYDLSNQETIKAYNELSKVNDLALSLPYIDITSSLESIRALIHAQNRFDEVKNYEGTIN